jgi:uncharacterized protein
VKLSGAYPMSVPPKTAYPLLQDPVMLARSIPGCESLDRIGPDAYAMRMKVGIGSLSGRFDGTVRIAGQKPSTSFRMIVEGSGKIGFVKGDGVITLAPADAGANVTFDGEVQVGGTIANVGQRLIETTAKMIIKRFFEKMDQEAASRTVEG